MHAIDYDNYERMKKTEGSPGIESRIIGHYSKEFLLIDFTILIQVEFVNHCFPIVDD